MLISGEWYGRKTHESLYVSQISAKPIRLVFLLPQTMKIVLYETLPEFHCYFSLKLRFFFQKKCAKYWPDLNDKHMEGCISIRCQKEQTYAENVVRHLRIHNTLVRHCYMYYSLIDLNKLIFVKSYFILR